ncbi:type II CAAX endopeptidase family protein [Undibacterium cyanobacteriorum]|uniref:Type II CAAX endopeptidase family protein n=1 Tax=Undibacterium cyanobacteriorum TaxID=3073561 RepID=A0ABY9RJA7_9BURK|nr:type II CAAX endopeptidase family protein [Undibacterium sp. 20NA77.5]WMW81290.1 type II CAAX endopeptidase family protein [Undibacterium sp. 20NA77.5]
MARGIELYANREPQHKRTWTLAAIILILVFFIVGEILGGLLIHIPGMRDVFPKSTWQSEFFQLVFVFGFGALLCFAWVKFFERRSLATIGFISNGSRLYGRGLLLGFGFISTVVGSIYLLGGYQIEASGIAYNFSLGSLMALVFLFLGFVVQGATEEIFMRGWLFQLLTSRYGVTVGIVGNMLMFSALHAGNIKMSTELLIGLFNIVLVAILLSLYAWKEGSLWGVCAWHSAWNWLLGVGFGLEVSGQNLKVVPLFIDLKNADNTPVWLNGGAFGPEASVVTSVILVLGIVYFGTRKSHGKVFSVPGEIAVDIKPAEQA